MHFKAFFITILDLDISVFFDSLSLYILLGKKKKKTVIVHAPTSLRLSSLFSSVCLSPIPAWDYWALISVYCNHDPIPILFRQDSVSVFAL